MESDISFRDNVSSSFKKVKEDIDSFRNTLYERDSELLEIKEELKNLTNKMAELADIVTAFCKRQQKQKKPEIYETSEILEESAKTPQYPIEKLEKPSKTANISQNSEKPLKSSIGNQGVYSFIHSTDIHSFNTKDGKSFKNFNKKLENTFKTLSKQEFLTFLSVYQLEEELGNISYFHISKHMNLSEGCIRTYISSLIRKGAPVLKEKTNNKLILLKIDPEFRKMGLKTRLFDIYNDQDSNQKRIFDSY